MRYVHVHIYIYIHVIHLQYCSVAGKKITHGTKFFMRHFITFLRIVAADLRHSLAELCRNRAGEVGVSFMYRHGAIWRNYRQLI